MTILHEVKKASMGKRGSLLAVASPPTVRFTEPLLGNREMGKLQYAEREAQDVSGMFAGKALFIDKSATETVVKKQAGTCDALFLSTHGLLLPAAPTKSFILFEKDAENDGRLTVDEIGELRGLEPT